MNGNKFSIQMDLAIFFLKATIDKLNYL